MPSLQATGDSDEGIGHIYDAIQQVSSNTGVDNRVILSIIMQESHGKINTNNAGDGQNTPGLMQAMGCPNHAGEADVSRVCSAFQSLPPAKALLVFPRLCEQIAISIADEERECKKS